MLVRTTLVALLVASLWGCAAPAILAGATAGGIVVAHDRRSTGTQIDDQTIELKAIQRLADDPSLSRAENARISVTSFNGVVLLTGETRTDVLRRDAEQRVAGIAGVRKVYNEIEVAEPASLGGRSNDTWLTTKVKSKLFTNEELDGTRIKVVTSNSVVYLMGLVNRAESNIATSVASGTSGVERIVRVFEYVD